MKILFLDSPAFAKQDLLDAFAACNIQYDLFFHNDYHERQSPAFETAFLTALEKCSYDFVFSFNYFPIISRCCQKKNTKSRNNIKS